jgi:tetratricopeptide (TPR) repeat protein
MDFPSAPPRRIEAPDGLAEALGVLPLEVWASTYLVAILEGEAAVRTLAPDIPALNRVASSATGGRGNIVVAALSDSPEQDVVSRFPDSSYARDARLKIDLARDHLAGKEMTIGRWYQRQRLYAAAIGRFRRVIEEYQTTNHVPEALHRLTEIYLTLGITEEARKTASVLGYNFPGSPWYQDSYALLVAGADPAPEDRRGFFRRAYDWLF